MVLSSNREYSSEISSSPPYASSYHGQYLGATQLSNSTCDSDEGQRRESSIAADQDLQLFFDFNLFDSDDSTTEAEAMSVVKTSGLVTEDSKIGSLALPLLDMLAEYIPASNDDSVADNTDLYRWLTSTEPDIEGPTIGLGSTDNKTQWATKPGPGLYMSSDPENLLGTNSKLFLPSGPILAQKYMPNKVAVQQIHHHICPTCKRQFTSQLRFRFVTPNLILYFLLRVSSEHLRKSHQAPRFICSTCCRGFQYKKDFERHDITHVFSKPTFACSCKKSYTRLDSLRRHIAAQMAKVPIETSCHKPV
jgi:hypothetical protein